MLEPESGPAGGVDGDMDGMYIEGNVTESLGMTMTEVGAYEAIQSIRHIIDYEAAEAADNAALTHQDHMYVQRMSTKCGQCRRYFCSEEDLLAHTMVRHTPEANERFKCVTCNNGFATKGGLYKHQQIHTGKKQYICNTCNRAFNQLANLHRHNLVHTGEKPFECQTCGKRFSQQTNVNKHQVTHTRAKPFSCNICNHSFTQRANLQKHLMVHSNERPFGCPICMKRYAQEANMKKHMKTHNKINHTVAYLCAKCQKLFQTVVLFESHLATCTGSNEDYHFQLVISDSEAAVPGTSKINVMNVIKTEQADPLDQRSNDCLSPTETSGSFPKTETPQYLSEHSDEHESQYIGVESDEASEYLKQQLHVYPNMENPMDEPVQYLEQNLV